MSENDESIMIGVETVKNDLGISTPKAYKIIQELNKQLKKQHPNAIVIAGRVNRIWYYDALLRKEGEKHE